MKKIIIIGYGFVGQAVQYTFKSDKTSETYVHDPDKGHVLSQQDYENADAIFICVPTPAKENGECDSSIVLEYVRKFYNMTCPVIIRSTVPPSFTQMTEFEMKDNFIFMPEFLREKHWRYDCDHPVAVLIGTKSEERFKQVKKLYEHTDHKLSTAIQVDPTVASLYKYATNSFLAMKVVFMHQLQLASKDIADWNQLEHLLITDTRIGPTHTQAPGVHGYGYGGTCFPKDTRAFVSDLKQLTLLEKVIEENDKLVQINHHQTSN
jgi:UDPglucose 6-dehydrogenase